MEKRKNSIVRQMEEAHSSVSQPPNRNEIVIVTPVDKAIPKDRYADTLIFNKEEQRYQLSGSLVSARRSTSNLIIFRFISHWKRRIV